ncbi:MAG TPA: fumarate reductase/succinate dehydrogenase flavoprotein subunit, partial [Planctomycetota bacterium]|nr:fumarate reductase/succinate dehydrogenase flavoprotein subunit [Planctomycetota bacterium]
GLGAAEDAAKAASPRIDPAATAAAERELLAFFENTGEDPYAIHHDLQESMQALVGIYRTRADLEQAIGRLEELRARVARARVTGSRLYNPGWHLAFDLRNLIDASEMVARAALERCESRGAHSRLDFPKADPAFGKVNVAIRRRDGGMEVVRAPLPGMPEELRTLFEEKK